MLRKPNGIETLMKPSLQARRRSNRTPRVFCCGQAGYNALADDAALELGHSYQTAQVKLAYRIVIERVDPLG